MGQTGVMGMYAAPRHAALTRNGNVTDAVNAVVHSKPAYVSVWRVWGGVVVPRRGVRAAGSAVEWAEQTRNPVTITARRVYERVGNAQCCVQPSNMRVVRVGGGACVRALQGMRGIGCVE